MSDLTIEAAVASARSSPPAPVRNGASYRLGTGRRAHRGRRPRRGGNVIFHRHHKAAVWGAVANRLGTEQIETHTSATGTATLDEAGPRVYFYAPSVGVDLFADARVLEEIATDVMTAADRLREIARQS